MAAKSKAKSKSRSSVAVLAAAGAPVCCDSEEESVSVSVRQIDNGYVTRRTRYGPGCYDSSEQFSREKPEIEVETNKQPRGMGSLRDAVDSIK